MIRTINFIFVLHLAVASFYIVHGKIFGGSRWWIMLLLVFLGLYVAFFTSKKLALIFNCFDRVVLKTSLITWCVLLLFGIFFIQFITSTVGFATLLMSREDNAAWVNQASGLLSNSGVLLNSSSSEFFDYGVGGVYLGYIIFLLLSGVVLESNHFSASILIVGFSLFSYLAYASLALIYIFNFFHKNESNLVSPYIYGITIGLVSIGVVFIALLPLVIYAGFLSLLAVTCCILWVIFLLILQMDFPDKKIIYTLLVLVGYMAGQSWPFIFPVLAIFFVGCLSLQLRNMIVPVILFAIAFSMGGWEQLLTAISDRGGLVRLANTNGGSWTLPFFEYLNSVFAIAAIAVISLARQIDKKYVVLAMSYLGFFIFYLVLINVSPYARYTQSKIMLSGFVIGYALIFLLASKSRVGISSFVFLLGVLTFLKIPPYSMPFDLYAKLYRQPENGLMLAISKINFNQVLGRRIICKPDFEMSSFDNYYCARWVAAFSPLKGVEDRAYRNIIIRSNSANWSEQKIKFPWIDEYESVSIDYRSFN